MRIRGFEADTRFDPGHLNMVKNRQYLPSSVSLRSHRCQIVRRDHLCGFSRVWMPCQTHRDRSRRSRRSKKSGKPKKKLGKNEEELLDEVNRLRNKQNAWDHYIFDLKGSTGYRRRYGAEAGLMKAFLHNRTVSDAVSWAGGRVVKWMGDGVLGLFALDECGTDHPFKALSAALVALNEIKALNGKEPLRRLVSVASTDEYERADHEVHTKVALCSGALHFFDLAANEPSRSSNIAATPGVPSVGDMSSTLSQAVSPIPVLGRMFVIQWAVCRFGSTPFPSCGGRCHPCR